MQYLLSLIGDERETHAWEEITPEEMQATYERMDAFNKEMEKAGVLVHGAGLDRSDTATTVRFGEGGKTDVTDGPFAETKEWIAGFWVIECASLDEALEWTKKAPMEGGTIEVRPLITERDDLMSRVQGE
jgi:hypothetical protein